MNKSTRANLLLLLTAFIWGAAFVAQDVAMDALPPFTFGALRMLLAALAVLPFCLISDKQAARKGLQDANTGAGVPFAKMSPVQRKTLILGGLVCGLLLALGSGAQQLGISGGASAGKAGFVTALYIVLVPLFGVFLGRRIRPVICAAVLLSVAGLYLLCIKSGFAIEPSDLYLILCALCFAGHILVVDHFSRRTDCVKMSCLQFFVTSCVCAVIALLTERPTLAGVRACLVPILYTGILSGGLGYTLQIIAQKDTDPTVASLIMCLESVFAVLAGWLLLGDRMSVREYAGCAAMLCGILLAQWPEKKAVCQCEERSGEA